MQASIHTNTTPKFSTIPKVESFIEGKRGNSTIIIFESTDFGRGSFLVRSVQNDYRGMINIHVKKEKKEHNCCLFIF